MAIRAADLETRLVVHDRDFTRGMADAERRAHRFASNVNREFGRIGSDGGVGGLLPTLSNLSNVIQSLPAIGQMAGALSRPFTDAAREGFRLTSVIETAEIGFEGVAGSSERAKKHVQDLFNFAVKTPFRFEGMLDAARFMGAFGFSIDETIPKLRIWGDAIASTGDITSEKVNAVVRAMGQMKISGTLHATEMLQLTNANIPAWELLAKAIGKTVEQTKKLSEQGRLRAAPAMEAITAMMAEDPRYQGMMKRMESTTQGAVSRAQDVVAMAQARAMRQTTFDVRDAILGALTEDNEQLINKMAGAIDSTLAPLSEFLKRSIVTVFQGGFAPGFQEAFDYATSILPDSVTKMATEGIINPLNWVFQIQSPSRVTYAMGLMLAQGLNLGLQDGLRGQRTRLEEAAENDVVKAFFDAIKKAEGGQPDIMAGGRRVRSGRRHPGEVVPRSEWFVGPKGPSSAAGNWQITRTNWRELAPQLGLTDFSDERQQMLAALKLFDDAGGLLKLLAGDINGAIRAAGVHWAGVPGSPLPGREASRSDFMRWFQGGSGQPVPVRVVSRDEELERMKRDLAASTNWRVREGLRPIEMPLADDVDVALRGEMREPPRWGDDYWDRVLSGYEYPQLPQSAGFDVSLAKLTPGITNFINLTKSGTDAHFELLKALGRVGPEAEKNFGQASLAAGQWADKVIDSGNKAASFIGITSEEAAYAFESSWLGAVSSVEGGLRGMARRFGISIVEMLNQEVQQWAAQQMSQAIGKGIKAIRQHLFGGDDAGGLGSAIAQSIASESVATVATNANTLATERNTIALTHLAASLSAGGGSAGGLGGGIAGLFGSSAGGAGSAIASALSGLFGSAGGAGSSIGSAMSNAIPRFDTGGNFGPGWAYVHKDELVHFNTSGRVFNPSESARMMRGGSSQKVINNYFNVNVTAPPSRGYTTPRARREVGDMMLQVIRGRAA